MKLSLDLRTSLTQTLTPQQIQYLKLLQLPLVQLEQQVNRELEQNPMLEEHDPNAPLETEDSPEAEYEQHDDYIVHSDELDYDSDYPVKSALDEQKDPFEFYKLLWNDSSALSSSRSYSDDDEDSEFYQIKTVVSLEEEILQQLRMTNLSGEEIFLGEQIIGNVDNDGYFRRKLNEIVQETNERIAELNFEIRSKYEEDWKKQEKNKLSQNPARKFAVSKEALKITKEAARQNGEILYDYNEELSQDSNVDSFSEFQLIKTVTLEQAEKVLNIIRSLDPPGFASRTVQECLIAQCKAIPEKNPTQKLALDILERTYEAFAMKHYPVIIKQLGISEESLKDAIDIIKRLNPKPGGLDSASEMNSVIPDFLIQREDDTNELLINVNDSRIPILKLNEAYEKLKKEARIKVFNKETREWIRNKYEDAKFLIQAIRQRKSTMLKVMTAIAQRQKNFFFFGTSALKPLIYKDIAEETGLDISTVCRIVNGKYAQTEFGTYELKFFFSESLPSDDGEEISTTVIKQIIKEIIDKESKNKPFSDDKIGKELQKKGYQIARRTVAKYREQMKIPVARLRKEL